MRSNKSLEVYIDLTYLLINVFSEENGYRATGQHTDGDVHLYDSTSHQRSRLIVLPSINQLAISVVSQAL